MDSGDEEASREPSTSRMTYPSSMERAANESQEVMADTDTGTQHQLIFILSNNRAIL